MKAKLINSTRGRYSNRSWFPDETPIWERAYYTLYSSAAGKISQKTLDELVAILLSTDEGEVEFPLAQRAERILDQFRLDKTQYKELIDLLPLTDLLHPYGGIGYRFLIHPNITDDVYQSVIDRISNDKKMLTEFQTLTESCIRSVIDSLTTFTSYTRRWQQKNNANIITPTQFAHILRVLQRGEKKLDEKL